MIRAGAQQSNSVWGGRPASPTRVFGAVGALREVIGVAATPIFRPLYEQFPTAARVPLGKQNFVAAWAEGCALPLEQAIAYAVREDRSAVA